jgi:hypothetical protein
MQFFAGDRLKYLRPEDPISPWELSGLREGDILDPPSGPARNVIGDPKYNWPNNTVVYRFQPGMREMIFLLWILQGRLVGKVPFLIQYGCGCD